MVAPLLRRLVRPVFVPSQFILLDAMRFKVAAVDVQHEELIFGPHQEPQHISEEFCDDIKHLESYIRRVCNSRLPQPPIQLRTNRGDVYDVEILPAYRANGGDDWVLMRCFRPSRWWWVRRSSCLAPRVVSTPPCRWVDACGAPDLFALVDSQGQIALPFFYSQGLRAEFAHHSIASFVSGRGDRRALLAACCRLKAGELLQMTVQAIDDCVYDLKITRLPCGGYFVVGRRSSHRRLRPQDPRRNGRGDWTFPS